MSFESWVGIVAVGIPLLLFYLFSFLRQKVISASSLVLEVAAEISDEDESRELYARLQDAHVILRNAIVPYAYRKVLENEAVPALKAELSKRIKVNKDVVREIVSGLHQDDSSKIDDESMDWLFGLQVKEKQTVHDGSSWINPESGEQEVYQGTFYSLVREIVKKLNINEGQVFYDLGSGYGRVVLYMAYASRFIRMKGIELIERRVAESLKACERLELVDVEFLTTNVKSCDLSDGDVFFTFNSFSDETLEVLAEKLKEVAARKHIRVISFGLSNHFFNRLDWLKVIGRIKWRSRSYGRGVYFYESTPQSTPMNVDD